MKNLNFRKKTLFCLLFSFLAAINAFGQTPTQTSIQNASLGTNLVIDNYTWRVALKETRNGKNYVLLYGMNSMHTAPGARFGANNVYGTSEVRAEFNRRYAENASFPNLKQIAVLATLNNAPGFDLDAKSVLPADPQLASATGTTEDVFFLPSVGDVKGWHSNVNVVLSFPSTGRLITRNPFQTNPSVYLCAFITNFTTLTNDGGIPATTSSPTVHEFRPCIWVTTSVLPPTIGAIDTPDPLCSGDFLSLSAPTITDNGAIITDQGWQIEVSPGSFTGITLPYQISDADNGKKLRYAVTFNSGPVYSNEVSITVFPIPVLDQPDDLTLSHGDNVSPIPFTGANLSMVTWQVISGLGTAIGMSDNSGVGTMPGFTASNTTGSAIYVTFQVSVTSAAGCPGEDKTFTITVHPKLSVYHAQVTTCKPTTGIDVLRMGQYAYNRDDMTIHIVKQPEHASPVSGLNVHMNLTYTPDDGFQGKDSIVYTVIHTGTTIDTVLLSITVVPCPDNVSETDCAVEPESVLWTIAELTRSADNYTPYLAPLTGDIDGDGTVEIIVARAIKLPNLDLDLLNATQLEIFKGDDLNPVTPWLLDIDTIPFAGVGVIATARINNIPYIYTYARDGRIHAYNPLTNTKVWVTATMVMDVFYREGIALGLADFDGDGQPELYAGNKIYDAATGVLLWSGSGNSGTQVLTDFYRTAYSAISFAADVTGDGQLNLIAGNSIYDVVIDRTTPRLNQPPAITFNGGFDGFTQVADMNGDGHIDIIVSRHRFDAGISEIDVWDVHNKAKLASATIPSPNGAYLNYPLIGDIDKSGKPSIVVVYQRNQDTKGGFMDAYKYVNGNPVLKKSWASPYPIAESYARTGITLFDFNHDGTSEIVYRDMEYLRIINASGKHHLTGLPTAPYNLARIECASGTGYEYPVIADVNGDGYAEIITIGGITTTDYKPSYVRIFGASTDQPWAPARKVWNQYAYNVLNVNEDLTIPAFQMNPARTFPNGQQPYNNFLQQQTILSKDGAPLWLTPNVVPDISISSITVTGVSIDLTIGIINKGDAALTPPVYVSVYKNAIASANLITTVSENVQINPGDTAFITVSIPDLMLHLPFLNLIVNVNDNGTDFPVQAECDPFDNDTSFLNPLLSQLMKKDAALLLNPSVHNNGTYANPVSVLFSESIEYTITAINPGPDIETLVIRDTLPLYLEYVSGSATTGAGITLAIGNTGGAYPRDTVSWTITGVAPMGIQTVTFEATPVDGVCASQPLFINKAWVTIGDTLHIPTGNSTYHQGAGHSLITFSKSIGGSIYNAQAQALDYQTSPNQGVIVAPDEGYLFAGWSHDEYRSLRGKKIAARSGIMHYDTLTVYGHVDLKANFTPEEYAITYYLNGGYFPNTQFSIHHSQFTIESPTLTLTPPEKAGDAFTGWTGSNGDEPQMTVTIRSGSTGERFYYANFLHSGREDGPPQEIPDNERIWAYKDALYVRTTQPGSIVRIYTPDGVLHKVHPLVSTGETTLQLQPGLYIVTLNNSAGQKIMITDN